jgi:hypothetical protein
MMMTNEGLRISDVIKKMEKVAVQCYANLESPSDFTVEDIKGFAKIL